MAVLSPRKAVNGLPIALCLLLLACFQGPSSYVWCSQDEEIPAATRNAVHKVSLEFAAALASIDVDVGFRLLSEEARRATPRDQLLVTFRGLTEQLGQAQNLRIGHLYLAKVSGQGQPIPVSCGGTRQRPQDSLTLLAKPGLEQAYAMVEGDLKEETISITLWLVPEEGTWKVLAFNAGVSTALGKGAEYYWERARTEREHGHVRAAMVLYGGAAQLASRGQMLQLGAFRAIQQEIQQLNTPEDVRGEPPHVWKADRVSFAVTALASAPISGRLYLLIVHEVPVGLSDREIDKRNRELMRYSVERFPEYSHVFDGLVVAGDRADGSGGYRTVEAFDALRR